LFRAAATNLMDKRLQKIVDYFHEEGGMFAGAPTNNASSGAIAGLPPDQPPVRKKKKRYIFGKGYRKLWQQK
jgi:hypothetical protein